MFLLIKNEEGKYIDLNVQNINYVQYCTWRKDGRFYRVQYCNHYIDITEESYDGVLEPAMYKEIKEDK